MGEGKNTTGFLGADSIGRRNPSHTGAAAILALLGWFFVVSPADSQAQERGLTAPHAHGVVNAPADGGAIEALLFYGIGGVTVVSAVGVCIARNIVRMAVWLFAALGSVSMLYFLLAANFLGAIQLIVYAGGTLVLLIYGVMLTSKSPWVRFDPRPLEVFAAAAVCLTLFGILYIVITETSWSRPEGVVAGTALRDFGRKLLTTYLVPFEVAGVLLMIVMVGAAHLARQDR